MTTEWEEIVLADFEFEVRPGEGPVPVCLVAQELRSGRKFRLLAEQLGSEPPYAHGPGVLFVAYYASAELGCYLALGWPMPANILDLFCEFRCRTNGLPTVSGSSLLGALAHFGLDHLAATEKKTLQQAIGTGTWRGVYSEEDVLDYCEADVVALAKLLPAMLSGVDTPRALLRGRYMAAAALRLACCFATERGVEVCAPVHDAVLICAPLGRLDADMTTTRMAMAQASRVVLGGLELASDVKIVRWPDRYMDPRGAVMWSKVMKLLDRAERLRA
jgi:hypothetical protein